MADNPQPESTTEKQDKKPGMMTLLKALAVVSIIVLLEVVAVSMVLPTSQETTVLAKKLASAEAAQEEQQDGQAVSETAANSTSKAWDMREVSLGTYHVLTYDPETGSSLNVDFELYGTVLADEEGEFFQLYDANQIRIREQILITMRSMEVTDLSEAGLGLIKRKILEKTNRALGKPLLHEAIFSKFSFVER